MDGEGLPQLCSILTHYLNKSIKDITVFGNMYHSLREYVTQYVLKLFYLLDDRFGFLALSRREDVLEKF